MEVKIMEKSDSFLRISSNVFYLIELQSYIDLVKFASDITETPIIVV
jgi:hypothetical protein